MPMTTREKAEAKLRDLAEKERLATRRRKEQEKALAATIEKEMRGVKLRIGEAALSVNPDLEHLTESELVDLFKKVFATNGMPSDLEPEGAQSYSS